MNSNNHPSSAQLADLANEPDLDRFSDIRAHLLSCHECRKSLSTMRNVERWVSAQDNTAAHSATVSFEEFELFHAGALKQQEHQRVSEELAKPQNLKARLHYSARMIAAQNTGSESAQSYTQEVLGEVGASNKKAQPQAGDVLANARRWLSSLLNSEFPLWMGVPATALATCVLMFALFPSILSAPDAGTSRPASAAMQVATYQDAPVVVFSEKQSRPGIGFFADAQQSTAHFDGMAISLDNNGRTQLQWQSIPQAKHYTLRLYALSDADRTPLGESKTTEAQAVFEGLSFNAKRRYGWELTGETSDGKFFHTSGGFVALDPNQ